jgi:hypothetical protein
MRRILAKAGITLGGLAPAVGSAAVTAPTAQAAGTSAIARFEGRAIDLSKDCEM